MSDVELIHGDCLDVLRTLPDVSVDAVVTDPPYGLGFMGRAWDALPLGREWVEECLRALKPGGHLLAFGGTRTWHRLACAIEDAGFEVRDSIAWMYGSGFPKSLDVSKAIDKLDAADERLSRARTFQAWLRPLLTPQQVNAITGTQMGRLLTTHPNQPCVATPAMLDRLRPHVGIVPAHIERIVVDREVESQNFKAREVLGTRKQRSNAGNPDRHVGLLASTHEVETITTAHTPEAERWQGWGTALKPAFEPIVVARKPLRSTVAANIVQFGTGALNIDANRTEGRWPANVILDEATALDLLEAPYFYTPKADSDERVCVNGTTHPTVKPLALMRWLVRLVTPPGGIVLEPFAGSGTTVEACILEGFDCIAIEREADYLPLIQQRIDRRRDPVAAVKATQDDGGLFDLLGGGAA